MNRTKNTMKKIIFILLFLLLHSLAIADDGVEIKMSEVHKAGHVVIKPSTEYRVNLEGYKIPEEAKLVIFHVLESPRSHYYYQQIEPGKSVYQMTASDLKASTGSPPFGGLENNDSAFLLIGRETHPGSINMGILYSNESIAVIVRE